MKAYGRAKVLTEPQIKGALGYAEAMRHPERNSVMLLLSVRAGLRACEISGLDWSMVLDGERKLTDLIEITNDIAKKQHGRMIPMHPELGEALQLLYDKQLPESPYEPVIVSERGNRMKPNVIVHWFKRFYSDLGFDDCSSHSGRRTLATNSARNLSRAGASLKDLQDILGHRNLSSTQVYLEASSEAKKKLIEML